MKPASLLSDQRIPFVCGCALLAVLANGLLFVIQFPGVRSTAEASVLTSSLPAQRDVYSPPLPIALLGSLTATHAYVSSEAPVPLPLVKYNVDDVVPLASVTKLMTAFVALTYEPDWDASVVIESKDRKPGAKQRLHPGDTVSVQTLWQLMLIASDNDAATALARVLAGDEASFVQKMNALAVEWGISDAVFTDPSGLDPGNRSSARAFAVIARRAFAQERIVKAVATPEATVDMQGRTERIFNTDQILQDKKTTIANGWTLTAGKTGYIDEAGYNIVFQAEDRDGRTVLVVLLGATSSESRASEAMALATWAFTTVAGLPEGQRLGERLLY